jgi:membrane-associated phospholipid phosphatase
MVTRLLIVVLSLMLSTAAVQAQSPGALVLPTKTQRTAATWVSQATLLGAIGADTYVTMTSEHRTRAALDQGLRLGVAWAWLALNKRLRHAVRPCVDLPEGCGREQPFTNRPSGHALISALGVDWLGLLRKDQPKAFALSLSMNLGTAAGRVAAGKHTPGAVLEGLAEGAALGILRQRDTR